MKCVVCGKEHSAPSECPVCRFPVIRFPGDPVEGMKAMKPQIDSYRAKFLETVDVSIVVYKWKDENGYIVEDSHSNLSFGSGTDLYGNQRWIPQKFARIPEEKSLTVEVLVKYGDTHLTQKHSIPNLMESELQECGASLDEDMNICFMLRNDSHQENYTSSNKVPLFP